MMQFQFTIIFGDKVGIFLKTKRLSDCYLTNFRCEIVTIKSLNIVLAIQITF